MLKIVFLAMVNAMSVWAAVVLVDHHKWRAVAVLAAATLAIDAIYLVRRWTLPLKFLIPGTVFLLGFQVIPVAYTINVAFTNYSTGHILSHSEAVEQIEQNSLTEGGASYTMAPARDADGRLVLILLDESGRTFVGSAVVVQRADRRRQEDQAAGVRDGRRARADAALRRAREHVRAHQ